MRYNQKKIFLLLGILVMTAVLASWNGAKSGDDRNLKVLPKDISPDSLERVMDHFVTSLNVDCRYCHAPKDPGEPKKLDYASDANPKKDITRSMLRMTNEMNERFISQLPNTTAQRVTCNTCHRGETIPQIK